MGFRFWYRVYGFGIGFRAIIMTKLFFEVPQSFFLGPYMALEFRVPFIGFYRALYYGFIAA